MAPPTYGDLGKSAKDIFTKGYHFGLFKLDVKSTTSSGLEINPSGTHSFQEGQVFGNLETKYKVPKYGVTFTEKWNTDNNLTTEVSCQDKIAPGFKIAAEGVFNPETGKNSNKLKVQYKLPNATIDATLDGGYGSNVLLNGSVVLGYQGWLGGYQGCYSTKEGKVTKNNLAVGYSVGDFQVNGTLDKMDTFGVTLYQKVSNRMETGVQMAWTSGAENSTRFGVGARYKLDASSAVRAKVNNQSHIGIGFEQKIRDGVTLTLSAFIDGKRFNAGGHQVGLCLELEP